MPRTAQSPRRESMLPEAVFGGFDGAVSCFGVVTGLLAGHGARIVGATVGLAVASSLGMAVGQYQADEDRSIPAAAVMGGATFAGTLLPTIGFWFLTRTAGIVWMAGACVLVTALIGYQRRAWLQSFLLFAVVAAATFGVSLLTGSIGG